MDWQTVQPFFDWLSENPHWSGFFVFLIAATESLLIIGWIVPGVVLMFGIGVLVGTGVLGFKETLIIAFAGAVAGDGISFWIGRYYQESLSKFWPFNKKPEYLERGKSFFTKHGGKSIIFGRFVGPVRPIVPAVAGMMGMRSSYFFTINVFSALIWAPVYLLPGIVFGTSIGLASVVGTRMLTMLVVLVLSAVLLFWLTKRIMLFGLPRIDRFYQSCYGWASRHAQVGKLVIALIDPETSEKHGLTFFAILILSLSVAFTLFFSQLVVATELRIDLIAQNVAMLVRTELMDEFMLVIRELFSWVVFLLLLINCVAIYFGTGQYYALRYLLLSLLLAAISISSIQLVLYGVDGLRTSGELFRIVLISNFFAISAVLIHATIQVTIRWIAYATGLLFILLMCIAALYFGDVTFSSLLILQSMNVMWALLLGLAYRRHAPELNRLKILNFSTLAIFLVVGSLMIQANFERKLTESQLAINNESISQSHWINDAWSLISEQRKDVFGMEKQSLNIQWSGEVSDIEQSLSDNGWKTPMRLDVKNWLYWLKPELSLDEYARLPQTHQGLKESLVKVKFSADKTFYYVIQLWQSKYLLADSAQEIWVASLTRQSLDAERMWIPYTKFDAIEKPPQEILVGVGNQWEIISKMRQSGLSSESVLLIHK